MKIILKREKTSEKGTFGRLFHNEKLLAFTCEDPWNNNAKGKSCIPEGIYDCKPHSGTKYKNVWEITKVPNRSAILIHNGNTINDTEGCVLVGSSFGEVSGLPAVIGSRTKLEELRKILPKEFIIEIINDYR